MMIDGDGRITREIIRFSIAVWKSLSDKHSTKKGPYHMAAENESTRDAAYLI